MTASLYIGETTHHRRGPRPHRFRYRLFQLLIDVDRIEDDVKPLTMLRKGRFGLFSYSDRDHGYRDGRPLRGWVQDRLAEAGVAATARTIRLLCFPRVLGFVFNPISLVFVENGDGALEAVIYEVNNTFGQTHAYVAPARGRGWQRQTADKRLFVSPFYGMDGAYRFEVAPPGKRLSVSIVKLLEGRPAFTATLSGYRQPLTDARLLALFLGFPLMTLGIVAAIHWQALRLFVKGVPLVPRPAAPNIGTSAAVLHSRAAGKNDVILPGTEGSADDADQCDAGHDRPRMGPAGPA